MSGTDPHVWSVRTARTVLFVPADRPDRFDRAFDSGADLVVLDLEDAVLGRDKEAARGHVRAWLTSGRVRTGVRVNGSGSREHADDLQMLAGVGPASDRGLVVMVPKSEDPRAVAEVSAGLPAGAGLIALVETSRGVLAAPQLAGVPAVARLALGNFDLAAELGVRPDDVAALAPARGLLVLASAAAGLGAPLDGVTGELRDMDVVRRETAEGHRVGFGGKLCIHPRQIDVVRDVFVPDPTEVAWALRVVRSATEGGGVSTVDGQLVDLPVVRRARDVLARADGTTGAVNPDAAPSRPVATNLGV